MAGDALDNITGLKRDVYIDYVKNFIASVPSWFHASFFIMLPVHCENTVETEATILNALQVIVAVVFIILQLY